MIGAALIVVLTLVGLIGLGALIMALAQDMARGPESYPMPRTHIFVQDWSDFAGKDDAQHRPARPDGMSANVLPIRSVSATAAGVLAGPQPASVSWNRPVQTADDEGL
jgi:hypothetical protein